MHSGYNIFLNWSKVKKIFLKFFNEMNNMNEIFRQKNYHFPMMYEHSDSNFFICHKILKLISRKSLNKT